MSVLFQLSFLSDRGLRKSLLLSLAVHGCVVMSVASTPFVLAQRVRSPLAARLAPPTLDRRPSAPDRLVQVASDSQNGQAATVLSVPRKAVPARPQARARPRAGGGDVGRALPSATLRPAPESSAPANAAPVAATSEGLDAGALRGLRVGLAQALLAVEPPALKGAAAGVAHLSFGTSGQLRSVTVSMDADDPVFSVWLSQALTRAAARTPVPAALSGAAFEVDLPVEWCD